MFDKKLEYHDYVDIACAAAYQFREGNYPIAWKMYSYREVAYFGEQGRTSLGIPAWKGQDLKGKTLALCYEQTLGEQVLFASMIPELEAMGAKLVVEVDERLVPLLSRSFPNVRFVPWGAHISPHMFKADYYAMLGNPGLRLRDTKQKFNNQPVGYLKATPLTFRFSPSVGISWYSPAIYDGKTKNIPIEAFSSIYSDTNRHTINLQYGALGEFPRATTYDIDPIKDIDALASVIDSCDYVVTISNTVAHLASALGKRTFVLLTKGVARLWYWDVPFYPNTTRVELPEGSTWKEVIDDIHRNYLTSNNISI